MQRHEFEHIIMQMRDEWLRVGERFFGGAGDDAADALQETLLRLWVVRERLESAADVRALGLRIMKNECVNICRHGRRAADEEPPDVATMDENPHLRMAQAEDGEMLRWAVANLPESTRCLMQLQLYEGMSLDEIAAATGKTKGSVKTMISNAKKRIALWIRSYE